MTFARGNASHRRRVTPPRATDLAMTVVRTLFSDADGASVATVNADEDGDKRDRANAPAQTEKDENRDDDDDDGDDASRADDGALAGVSPIKKTSPRVASEDEREPWTSPRPTADGEASFRFDSTFGDDSSSARGVDDDGSFESADDATMVAFNATFDSCVDAHDVTFHSVVANRSMLEEDDLSDFFDFGSTRAKKKKFRARVGAVIRAVVAFVGGFVVAREVAVRVSAKMEERERRRKCE